MGIKNNQKLVLVTGASRGIGRSIAERMMKEGHFVVGTATTASGAEKISTYLNENGVGLVLNLMQDDSIDALFDVLKTQYQLPDILVNNAGITADNIFMRMSDDQWSQVIATNLTAIFKLSKACIRVMMKKRWGRIVTIGSVVGVSGNPGQSNYCASKAGVLGFSKSLALEVASRNITVNVVSPGFIESDMTAALTEAQQSAILASVPSGKMGAPEDVASAVAYLASNEASYVTGVNLHVNGGLYLQ